MELRDYLRILRNRWQIIALCIAVGVALGALFGLHSPKKYQSQTQLFVSTSAAATDPTSIFQGGQFTQARVQSYADIVGGPLVADMVAAQIGGGLTARTVEHEVSATAPANTVLLNITVTDRSPTRAQQIAAGIGQIFPTIVKNVEASDGNGVSPVKVSVVKPATFSTSPTSPKTVLDLGLALIVGLLVGVGGAVLRETLDNTVKTPQDLQAITGAATIGAIAFDPDAKKQPLIVAADMHGSRAEAFRQLRTNLQFVEVDSRLRSIVFTSSVPGEGKSTTVCNLSITLAQAGVRVLLVEADLRRPRVGAYLGLESSVGLTNVLIGAVSFNDAVQHWSGTTGLDVLPSGPPPPNPSELLGSRNMASLLHELEDRYDLVLLDAPPLLPVTDAAVIATAASGSVIVVHHGKTRTEQVHRATEALVTVGAKVLGCVINFTPRRGPDAYYYGYGYAYSYRDPTDGAAAVQRPAPIVPASLATTEPASDTPSPERIDLGSLSYGATSNGHETTPPPASPPGGGTNGGRPQPNADQPSRPAWQQSEPNADWPLRPAWQQSEPSGPNS